MSKKEFLSLGPSPPASSEAVTHVMKANKAKGTRPELIVRRGLWGRGIRGYRVNYKGAPGSPDICFTRWKIAVFINGCYWHRCPYCKPALPKTNTDFWSRKFTKNIERDRRKRHDLREAGWTVITIWECKLKKNPEHQIDRIISQLARIKNTNTYGECTQNVSNLISHHQILRKKKRCLKYLE